MTETRTLRDYRPQHDDHCTSRDCAKCGHSMSYHGSGIGCTTLRRHDGDWPVPCGCKGESFSCSCGLDALLAQPPAQGWQPMETAKKNRERLILQVPDELGGWEVQVGTYDDDYQGDPPAPFWRYDVENESRHAPYSRSHPPTHWMPLPALPTQDKDTTK